MLLHHCGCKLHPDPPPKKKNQPTTKNKQTNKKQQQQQPRNRKKAATTIAFCLHIYSKLDYCIPASGNLRTILCRNFNGMVPSPSFLMNQKTEQMNIMLKSLRFQEWSVDSPYFLT